MVRISRVVIIVAAAAVLATASCTVKKTERPALTGPSELALSLSLTANPDIITQDGTSQSFIVILARDPNGAPVKGLPLHVTFAANVPLASAGRVSTTDVTTGTDGRATVSYTAPPQPPDQVDRGIVVTISVTPKGTDFSNAVPRSVNIRLVPPDVVTPGPVASFALTPSVPVINSQVTFDGSASRSPSGTITTWFWDFGDSTTASGPVVQHMFRTKDTFKVSLVVGDSNGRTSAAATQMLVIDEGVPPTADFVVSPTSPAVGATVFFNASTSKPGIGRAIVSYTWDFGNGTATRSGVTQTTTYPAAGTYKVLLTVTDDIGQTAVKTQDVTVK